MIKKVKTRIVAWVLAGVLTIGSGYMALRPVSVVAAENEKKQEKTDKVRASDHVLSPQREYGFADMGLSFELSEKLFEKMEKKEVAMLPGAALSADGNSLKFGYVSWSKMTEEQREAKVEADGTGFSEWVQSLGMVGCLGTYQKELEGNLDEITGCTEHEKIGTSQDEDYVYYLSINKDADKELADELKKIKTEIVPMVSYSASGMTEGDSVGSFVMEDIHGKEYTEKLFGEADLTMVNVFATWCGPCVEEIPYLVELDKEMKEDGVQILGVVMDTISIIDGKRDEDAVKKAELLEKKTKAEYPFLIPDAGYMNGRLAYVQAYPETFFVDRNGNIVGETYSGSRSKKEWKEIIQTELAKVKKEETK